MTMEQMGMKSIYGLNEPVAAAKVRDIIRRDMVVHTPGRVFLTPLKGQPNERAEGVSKRAVGVRPPQPPGKSDPASAI